MARLITEGFEMGDVDGVFDIIGAGTAITTVKRSGSYGARVSTLAGYEVGDHSEIYVRAGVYCMDNTRFEIGVSKDGTTTIMSAYFSFTSNSNTLVQLRVDGSGVDSSSYLLTSKNYHLVEIYFKMSDSDGEIILRVDGVEKMSYTGDTKPSTGTDFNRVLFDPSGDWIYVDDIAINDTTGSADNSWCDDGHIVAIKPNANGDSSDLNGSDGNKTDNYQLVDDIPADGDTSYVYSDVVDDHDLYNLESFDVPEGASIKRVWAEARAKDPGEGDIAFVVKTHSTEYEDSVAQALGSAYAQAKSDVYTTNPNTSAAWTESELDDLQVGVKIK